MKELLFFKKREFWILPLFCVFLFSCSKEYSIEDAANNPLAAGNWQFTEGANNFAGNIDTAFINSSNQVKELHLVGTSNDGKQQFNLVLFSDNFTVGSYKASLFQTTFQYGDGIPLMYDASQLVGEFIVQISAINDAMVTGIFSGAALKGDSVLANISDGSFKAVFNANNQPPSDGQLGSASGSCTPVTTQGDFTQGNPLTGSGNAVTVQVTVTTPGSYNIFTDKVNGVSFSGSGNFSTTGTFNVVLQGSGTPLSEGDQQFIVHYNNSQCAFTITFNKALSASNDYMPLSSQPGNYNWWKYMQDGTDVFYTQVLPAKLVSNGNSYTVIGVGNDASDVQNDTAGIYRKNAGIYYALLDYSDLTGSPGDTRVESIVLKDNVPAGTSWDGPSVSVTESGVTVQIHFKFTITEKAVPVNLGSFSFPDVIKVKGELYSGTTDLNISYEWWYARNVGLIYQKYPGTEDVLTEYNIFP